MNSNDINELAAALVAAQADFDAVPKTDTNPFFKSKYAGLPTVVKSATPILTKHGLAISQFVDGDGLTTYLLHTSGQFIAHTMTLHLIKQDPQSQGSAITYARRYAYMSALGLVADEDDDGNRASHGETKRGTSTSESVANPLNDLRAALSKKFPESEDRQFFLEGKLGRKLSSLSDLSTAEIAGLLIELA